MSRTAAITLIVNGLVLCGVAIATAMGVVGVGACVAVIVLAVMGSVVVIVQERRRSPSTDERAQ